jgi:hypothetical protein
MKRLSAGVSESRLQIVRVHEILQLSVLPLAGSHFSHRMVGLQLAFTGLRQCVAQAAATKLGCPAMETMERSGSCHEHLLVVTPLV